MQRKFLIVVVLTALLVACKNGDADKPRFVKIRADRSIVLPSAYPTAVDPSRVGQYAAESKSGGGYFYDEVLEYRVWQHPDKGAAPLNGKADYFSAFAQYEVAADFAKKAAGAEHPLVLVRQLEWIDEPEPEHYIPKKGERITEWQVGWLEGSKRTEVAIKEFLAHPRPGEHPGDDPD